jgi:hypothetical protein
MIMKPFHLHLTLLLSTLCQAIPFSIPRSIFPSRQALTLPSSGLPAPSGLSLLHIGLGVGHQNYTCSAPTSATTPTSIGATATLFDVLPLLSGLPSLVTYISPLAYNVFGRNPGQQVVPSTATSGSLSDLSQNVPAVLALLTRDCEPLGVHFFDSGALPFFHLPGAQPAASFEASKTGDVVAPSGALPGSIDWLQLTPTSKAGNQLGGVKSVYRVETAGGKANCEGVQPGQVVRVPYVAEYWYFGSN